MVDKIERVACGGKEILLVATAHVSQKSVELVKSVIEQEQPNSVCIELDEKRYQNMQNPKKWEDTDIIRVIKDKKVGFMLANLALSSYQKKMAAQLGTAVGGEMLQGIESAKATGAQLVLADRDIQTTFLRIWRKLNLWEKAKLFASLFFSFGEEDEVGEEDLQKLMESDILESMLSEMRQQFPKIGDVLISERDQYLAYKIKNAPGQKVVAVLGAAHVPGIIKQLQGKAQPNINAINTVPPKGKAGKIVGWAIPLLILGLIIFGFTQNLQTGLQQVGSWILWNGGLSALFTLLALGHPLSILTAFVAAPISSLNPLLAAGWFAGLVQATIQKPTVHDLHQVQTDIFSLKGFFKNRVLKVLMVVIMANIGSAIGTVVAGLDIVKNLF